MNQLITETVLNTRDYESALLGNFTDKLYFTNREEQNISIDEVIGKAFSNLSKNPETQNSLQTKLVSKILEQDLRASKIPPGWTIKANFIKGEIDSLDFSRVPKTPENIKIVPHDKEYSYSLGIPEIDQKTMINWVTELQQGFSTLITCNESFQGTADVFGGTLYGIMAKENNQLSSDTGEILASPDFKTGAYSRSAAMGTSQIKVGTAADAWERYQLYNVSNMTPFGQKAVEQLATLGYLQINEKQEIVFNPGSKLLEREGIPPFSRDLLIAPPDYQGTEIPKLVAKVSIEIAAWHIMSVQNQQLGDQPSNALTFASYLLGSSGARKELGLTPDQERTITSGRPEKLGDLPLKVSTDPLTDKYVSDAWKYAEQFWDQHSTELVAGDINCDLNLLTLP